MHDSYLSYSGFQCTDCLYRYWHTYKGHTPHAPDDQLGAIYGTVVGRLFETFFTERMWRKPGSCDRLRALAKPMVTSALEEARQPKYGRPGGIIVWRPELYANEADLLSDVKIAIPRGLATIKTHRLIGINAKAEVKLDSTIEGHRVAGRADFVMVRVPPHRDLVILDGKGSRKRGRYADVKQLQWYSLLYRERHRRLPDRTAFVYWHYDPPSNIDWCTVNSAEIDALKNEVVQKMDDLQKLSKEVGSSKSLPLVQSVYRPSPHIKNCRFCPYATPEICPKGADVVAVAAAQAKARESQQNGKPRTDSSAR
jgi:PD-(D/E)XK nuclease superfamily